jgi:hypothetical protein
MFRLCVLPNELVDQTVQIQLKTLKPTRTLQFEGVAGALS